MKMMSNSYTEEEETATWEVFEDEKSVKWVQFYA